MTIPQLQSEMTMLITRLDKLENNAKDTLYNSIFKGIKLELQRVRDDVNELYRYNPKLTNIVSLSEYKKRARKR